jgi:hypothetical protein
VGTTLLAHSDDAGSNPPIQNSLARVAAKSDEPTVLHHAVEVLFILVWIYGLANPSTLRADQMEQARKQHLNVKIVHVNGK